MTFADLLQTHPTPLAERVMEETKKSRLPEEREPYEKRPRIRLEALEAFKTPLTTKELELKLNLTKSHAEYIRRALEDEGKIKEFDRVKRWNAPGLVMRFVKA